MNLLKYFKIGIKGKFNKTQFKKLPVAGIGGIFNGGTFDAHLKSYKKLKRKK